MEKRYQVFVSSTFNDLQDERRMVFDAIIRKKCFPVGMESFPSLTRDSLGYIKEIIEESDFFLLLVGGRYGNSVDENGISFTELEYLHALEKKKPIIAFVRADWRNAPMRDESGAQIDKLDKFIKSVQDRFDGWKPWTREDLKMLVSDALEQAKKDHPEVAGWVRGDALQREETVTRPNAGNAFRIVNSQIPKLRPSPNVFVNGKPLPLIDED